MMARGETLSESRQWRDELGFTRRKTCVEFNRFFLNGDFFCILFCVADKKVCRTAWRQCEKGACEVEIDNPIYYQVASYHRKYDFKKCFFEFLRNDYLKPRFFIKRV